jgi:hypothetical protein
MANLLHGIRLRKCVGEGDSVGQRAKWIGLVGVLAMAVANSGAFEAMAPIFGHGQTIKIQPIDDREPPTAPRGLTAVPGTAIRLAWEPSEDGLTGLMGYNVYREGQFIGRAEGTGYIDSGVLPGAIHRYQVAAIDAVGNESIRSDAVTVRVFPSKSVEGIDSYSYPNPAVGGAVPVIRAAGEGGDSFEVRIFDLTGRLVESGTLRAVGFSGEGKTFYEFPWMGSIASGTYFGLVQGTSGGNSVRSRIKISVVR